MSADVLDLSLPKRDSVGVRGRKHIRRRISAPAGPGDRINGPTVPGTNANIGGDIGLDTEGDDPTTDDDATPAPPSPAASAPPPAQPLPAAVPPVSTKQVATPAAGPVTLASSAAQQVSEPPAETTVTTSSSTVPAAADSLPTDTTFRTRPSFVTETARPLPTSFSGDGNDDESTTSTTLDTAFPSTILIPSLSPSITTTDDLPTIMPTTTSLPYNKGTPHETKVAIKATVSIICIALSFGLLYCIFRFCPPIRHRWIAFKERRKHARQKRMGIDGQESPLPPPVVVNNLNYHTQPVSTWIRGGLGMRNISIENGMPRPLDEAHLRPPSYRSHWTASGASWVANGFRLPGGIGERASQRMTRWSERSRRSWFMGRVPVRSVSDGETDCLVRGLIADGMRPLPPPPRLPIARHPGELSTPELARISQVTDASTVHSFRGSLVSRNSGMGNEGTSRRALAAEASPSIASGGSNSDDPSTQTTTASPLSQAGFSTNARISDTSSLSAGTTSNAFRPVPSFGNVRRDETPVGNGNGLED